MHRSTPVRTESAIWPEPQLAILARILESNTLPIGNDLSLGSCWPASSGENVESVPSTATLMMAPGTFWVFRASRTPLAHHLVDRSQLAHRDASVHGPCRQPVREGLEPAEEGCVGQCR